MASTYTPNKVYQLQGTGDNPNTWGTVLNTNVFTIIDKNLGGRLAISVAGNSDVTLTQSQADNLQHTLTGLLTGSISYIFPNQGGFFFIYNNTTGAFTVTVKGLGGTGVVVPQGTRMLVFIDPTSNTAYQAFSTFTQVNTPQFGGTGVANNSANTITFSGNFGLTLTLSNTTSVTLPTSGTLATLAGSEILTNKTLTSPIINTPTLTVLDSALTIQDNVDATKQLQFQLSGITTGQIRTLTVPDASTTIVGIDATQTLTNKTINGSNNTITNVSLTTGITGILPVANGGTNNAFFTVSGPATSAKTYTFPNATTTILTTNAAVTVAQGGTGLATLTANNVILGNGTSTPSFVAPSTAGNVLTSNGTTWQSSAPGSTITSFFESAEQTMATTISVAHGLSRVPILTHAVYRCKTAELGYSIGDEIYIKTSEYSGGAGGTVNGNSMWADATNVGWSSTTTTPNINNKSTTAQGALTAANWKLVFRAWA